MNEIDAALPFIRECTQTIIDLQARLGNTALAAQKVIAELEQKNAILQKRLEELDGKPPV